jgi:hypothetical protein
MIERGAGGPVIVWRAGNGDVLRLKDFLCRNGHPPLWAPALLALLQQSMPAPKGSSSWFSIAVRSAAKPAPRSRIENSLGFPTGITGMALMARAYNQAWKFGVEMVIPDKVIGLEAPDDRDNSRFVLKLSNNERLRARSVVIARGRATAARSR